jgi:hypothetical protein
MGGHVIVADVVVLASHPTGRPGAAAADSAWLDGAAATDGTDR